jgi:hypothetical protein
MRTLVAVAAVAGMLIACSGGPDAAEPSCPTPVAFGATAYDCEPGGEKFCPGGTHATCSPSDRSWVTFDPPALHCEWRCVEYGCAAVPQDVTVTLALDGTVLAVAQADAQGCP